MMAFKLVHEVCSWGIHKSPISLHFPHTCFEYDDRRNNFPLNDMGRLNAGKFQQPFCIVLWAVFGLVLYLPSSDLSPYVPPMFIFPYIFHWLYHFPDFRSSSSFLSPYVRLAKAPLCTAFFLLHTTGAPLQLRLYLTPDRPRLLSRVLCCTEYRVLRVYSYLLSLFSRQMKQVWCSVYNRRRVLLEQDHSFICILWA